MRTSRRSRARYRPPNSCRCSSDTTCRRQTCVLLRDAVRDPRVLARGETVPLEHPQFGRVADVIGMGVPITFSDASAGCVRPAPSVGQDNALVYGDWLGYGAAGVEQLQVAGII